MNNNLVTISQNLQNQKKDTLQNKSTGTALTPSEIHELRQDLKEAYELGKFFFSHRAEQMKHLLNK